MTTIARNLIADHVKSSRNRLDRSYADIPEPRTPLDESSVEEQAQARSERVIAAELVQRCLAGLTADQRRVMEQYEPGTGQSVREVAAAMGRSPSALKMLLRRRALCAMREQLAEQGLFSTEDCVQAGQRRRPAGRGPGRG